MENTNFNEFHMKENKEEYEQLEKEEVLQTEIYETKENTFYPILKNTDINNLVNNKSKIIIEAIKGFKDDKIFESYIDGFKNTKTYGEKLVLSNTMLKFQQEVHAHQKNVISYCPINSDFLKGLGVGLGVGAGLYLLHLYSKNL